MSSFFATLFRRAPQVPANTYRFPYKITENPYRCKRPWPPEFSQLSSKHQFRLERRYRRRSKLKWARPQWIKGVKLVQWGSILFVLMYGVLYLEVDEGRNLGTDGKGRTVFDGVRDWYQGQIGGMESVAARGDGRATGKEGVMEQKG